MNKKRVKFALFGALFLLVLLLICWLTAGMANQSGALDGQEKKVIKEVDLYRNQGLDPGVELSDTPEQVDNTSILFSDRILLRCSWTNDDVTQSIQALKSFLGQVQIREKNVAAYVMAVPLRIGFEEPFCSGEMSDLLKQEKKKLKGLEQNLLSSTAGLAASIPLMDVLEQHKQEYIFYRTDSAWTARGAYYGAQEFLAAAGLESFPIESFQESVKSGGRGALANQVTVGENKQYIYLYENYNPLIEKIGTGEKAPMVSIVRGGTGTFIGYDFHAYKIDGLAENGRVLMIMGKRNGAVLTPWLVTQFEKIIYIDLSFFSEDDLDFWTLFSNYKITDLLIIEDSDSITSSRVKASFNGLAGDIDTQTE